jgi:pantoate--beta-alanine ligase
MQVREMTLAMTRAQLAAARSTLDGSVAVVMTMGALHEGHAELMRQARRQADHVIVTVFVNPLQFGPQEDLSRYPRTLEADLVVCRAEGVDVVFAPGPDEVYPGGEPRIRVQPGPLATVLEGAHRRGHFDGVLTVVLKLLHLTRAHVALFGEKDYQQLTLIRAMVIDLDVPVTIVGVPTVREADGLALSSRNRFLSVEQRGLALTLSRALRAGAQANRSPEHILAAARAELAAAGATARAQGPGAAIDADQSGEAAQADIVVDYLELTDPWLGPPPERGPARLLIAARVGSTRLIDNIFLEVAP